MRKYVVIKEKLNIRNRPLVQDEFFIGFARLGEELWLDDSKSVEGDTPPGTQDSTWIPDANGNLVSRAGVRPQNYDEKKFDFLQEPFSTRFIDEADKENEAKWRISWGHVDTEVWQLWQKGYTGRNIHIAVLDTGVDHTHTDLTQVKGVQLLLQGESVEVSPEFRDFEGHGTSCCGLVGADGAGFYSGLAPASEVFAIKLYDDTFPSSKKEIFLLLKRAFDIIVEANQTNEKFDFVSMSFSVSDKDLEGVDPVTGKSWIKILQEKIDLIAKTSFILCSAGEYDFSYPAQFNNVYAVEGAGKNRTIHPTVFDRKKIIYAPAGDNLKTTTLKSRNPPYLLNFMGSSAATAFTAGYLALNYSRIKDGTESRRKMFADAIESMLQQHNNFLGTLNFSI